jgi:hypothetical protein
MDTEKDHGTPPGDEGPHTEHEKHQEQRDDGAEQTNPREANRTTVRWKTPTSWADDVELSLDTTPSTIMSPSSPKWKKTKWRRTPRNRQREAGVEVVIQGKRYSFP